MTSFGTILRLIPPSLRRRGAGIAASVLLRQLLDLAGLALLIPVLVLLFDPSGIAPGSLLGRLGAWTGLSDAAFTGVLCGGALLFTVAKNMLCMLLGNMQTRYAMELYRYFSVRLFDNYYRRGLLFVKGHHSVDLSHKINGVCYAFGQGVLSPMFTMAGEALLFMAIWLFLLVLLSWATLLLTLCLGLAVLLYSLLIRRRLERCGRAENEQKRRQARTVTELFRGYAEVEINGAFEPLRRRFVGGLEDISASRVKIDRLVRLPAGVIEGAVVLGLALMVLIYGGSGASSTAAFGLFAVGSLRMLPAVRAVVSGFAQIRNNRFSVEVIAEAFAADPPCAEMQAEPLVFSHTLQAREVTFAYPDALPAEPPALDSFSLEVRRGERIGIQGASGAGKSTLFNLLLGFYAPASGEILIDGRPLTAANRASWHRQVGYVPQEVFVIDGSLAENIAFGQPIDLPRIRQVLEQTRLADWAAALPCGVDTLLGENGCRLSGGERQRLGLARALYKGAEVLFLDEPTSSLDPATEAGILESIRQLSDSRRELTILMISHRRSSLDFCDRVLSL